MQEKHVRSLACVVVLLVFFPAWIAANYALSLAIQTCARWTGLVCPPWMAGTLQFAVFAAILLGLAYTAARRLNRRYPDSPARSASWNEQD